VEAESSAVRPLLPFQLTEPSSAVVSIAVVLISSGAPEEINLGTGKGLFHCSNARVDRAMQFRVAVNALLYRTAC
jgi:hypothetical protein